jgi:hypothetical protein
MPSGLASIPNGTRKYLFEKFGDSNNRKNELPINQPPAWPKKLVVPAQPTFSLVNKKNNKKLT